MMESEKVRENRLRRLAERRGLKLEKSRRRDPLASDYGRYRVCDDSTGSPIFGWEGSHQQFSASLDDVESFLKTATREQLQPTSGRKIGGGEPYMEGGKLRYRLPPNAEE